MSPADLAIIAIVALVVFGPKSLPQIAREFREALENWRGPHGGGPGGPAAA